MPEWVLQLGAAGAVIYVVYLFLKELRAMGKSRDLERQAAAAERKEERDMFLATLEQINNHRAEERKAFTDGIMALVNLAQKMVDCCQGNVDGKERVTSSQIIAATKQAGKEKRNASHT